MTTMVGTQNEFHDALYALCELDYDAIEAYKVAVEKLNDPLYKQRLLEFMHDHERHVEDITGVLKKYNKKVPNGPDLKQYLTQGKVVIAELLGDKAILKAMVSNEVDTNTAYERVDQHPHKWPEADTIIKMGLIDEKKHKQWLEENT